MAAFHGFQTWDQVEVVVLDLQRQRRVEQLRAERGEDQALAVRLPDTHQACFASGSGRF